MCCFRNFVYALGLAASFTVLFASPPVGAVSQYIQTKNASLNGTGLSVSATFTTAATQGSLLVAVCGLDENAAISGPAGFSAAINQAGTPSQGIFYKIAGGGETALSCSGGTTGARRGIHIYEYRGIDRVAPLHMTSSATGLTSPANSGSVTTTSANILLLAGLTSASATFSGAWGDSFTERHNFTVGNFLGQSSFGGAERAINATGTYSTSLATGVGNWRGQIAAFNLVSPTLSTDIVDSGGSSVGAPSAALQPLVTNFACGSVTGTLGTTSQAIRIQNYTSTAAWTLAIAPTAGATTRWTNGSEQYDFNDTSGAPSGCTDGADADLFAGKLTIDPSTSSLAAQPGCTLTGISRGINATFTEGAINSITLLSSNVSALINCYWDITGIGLSQTIPPEQRAGSYSLNMTLTLAAS